MNVAQRAFHTIRGSTERPESWNRRAVWLGAAVVAALVLALPRGAGRWLRGKKVKDVMVRSVTAVDAAASLMEAADRMRQADVGVLPVLEDGKVRGVITDRDLVVRAMARGADAKSTRVSECQTRNIICAQPAGGGRGRPAARHRHPGLARAALGAGSGRAGNGERGLAAVRAFRVMPKARQVSPPSTDKTCPVM